MCTNLSFTEYQQLALSDESWFCHSCLNVNLPFNSLDSNELSSVFLDMNSHKPVRSDRFILDIPNNVSEALNPVIDANNLNYNQHSCDYFTETNLQTSFNLNDPLRFSFLHMNIRSLPRHFDQMQIYLQSLHADFSIVGLSETWLKISNMPFNIYTIPGYNLETNSRAERVGGGVALYISVNLQYVVRHDLSHFTDSFESIFIEINNPGNKNIIAGVVYKPPSASFNDFLSTFQDLQVLISSENKLCLISGDFNINLLEVDHHDQPREFLDTVFAYSCIPLINKPTRITSTSATLIDNIFTNILPPPNSGILVCDVSDHFPIFTSFPFTPRKSPHHTHKCFRKLSSDNLRQFKSELNSLDWSVVFSTDDPNISFNNFMDIFNHSYDKNIPIVRMKHANRKSQPRSQWITSSLLKSINHKNRLYHKYLSSPTESNRLKHTRYRNDLTSLLRSAKQNYYSEQFEKEKSSIKNTWKVINSVLKSNTPSKTTTINIHNQTINDPRLIAEHYNNFFVNIGPNLANKIPDCTSHFQDYLPDANSHSIFFNPVTEHELSSIVFNLPNKKSSGHDFVNCPLIKEVIDVISKPLTFIMNLSLSTGRIPDSMKIASVIPIFKSGDPLLVNNYRPISILSSFSKILERIVYIRTSQFLHKHIILSDSQFGFRAKHSTTHAILQMINQINAGIEQSLHTVGIFLDFSKAFDTIDHAILLSKLSYYGIRGIALEWFSNYLSNRQQYVCMDGMKSSLKEVPCGVPQGSLLGPLLFSIYINDFVKSSNIFSFILFADDSSLFCSHRNLDILVDIVNSELVHISNWIKANRLSLNINKTNLNVI